MFEEPAKKSKQEEDNGMFRRSHEVMKYLERGGEVILEEPELDRCVGVPKDRQHHYSEIRFKKLK